VIKKNTLASRRGVLERLRVRMTRIRSLTVAVLLRNRARQQAEIREQL